MTKYFTKSSDQFGISSINSKLSNDCTTYLTVVECCKFVEEANFIAL